MRLYISDQMIDVVDDLRKVGMSSVVHISQINKSRFKYSHSSVVNSIDDLNPFKLFDQVQNVVPIYQKAILLIILNKF